MEMYKTLNKELVEQVQEMRNTLKEYRDEILYLRAKNLEEKSNAYKLRQKCIGMAKAHCREYLDLLHPNSTILTHLLNESEAERTSTSSSRPRQSSRLAEEARRSSSVLQTRRSFNSISPIRTSTNEDAEETEEVQDAGSPDVSTSNLHRATGGIIEEVEDGDEALQYQIERNHDETFQDSMQDTEAALTQSINESSTVNSVEHIEESEESGTEEEEHEEESNNSIPHRTLRDVTNTMLAQAEDDNLQSSKKSKRTRASPAKCTAIAVENSKNVNLSRGKHVSTTRANNKVQSTSTAVHKNSAKAGRSATSFDELRHSSRLQQQDENSFRLSNQDVSYTTAASSFTLTDITMEQFRVESSSTPHNKNSPASKQSRPSRRCKPTSLAEPTLGTKLRNESGEQSLGANNKSRSRKQNKN